MAKTSRWIPAGAVIALVAFFILGFLHLESSRRNVVNAAEAELEAISRAKIDQIVAWREERLADASVLLEDADLMARISGLLDGAGGERMIRDRLQSLLTHYRYSGALLVGEDRSPVLILGETEEAIPVQVRESFSEVAAGSVPRFTEFSRDSQGRALIHVVLPLPDQEAFVVLRIRASTFLSPLLGTWPTPSETGEILMVRREGEEVHFLTELRFLDRSEPPPRFAITDEDLPAAQALRGAEGFSEGVDYRGQAVFAFRRAVPGTPWYLIAKFDRREVLGVWRREMALLGGLLLSLLGGTILLGFFWRQQGATADLKEKLALEEARKRSEDRYRALTEASADGVFVVRSDGVVRYLNQAAVQILGGSRESLLDSSMEGLFPTLDGEDLSEAIRQVLRTREPRKVTGSIRTEDGAVWLDTSLVPLFEGEDTQPHSVMGVSRDVSDQRRRDSELEAAYASIQREQELTESLLGSMPGIVYLIDFEGRFHRWNAQFEEATGYTAEELQALNALELFEGEHRNNIAEGIGRVADVGEATVEAKLRAKDGTETHFLFTGRKATVDGNARLVGMGIDISDRVRAEELVKEGQARFRKLIEESPVPQAFVNSRQEIEYFNKSFRNLFGYEHEDVPTLAEWWQLAYPDEEYRAWVLRTWGQAVEEAAHLGRAIEPIEYEVTCKSGETRTVEISGVTIGDSFLVTFADMTERRRVSEELQESRERYRGLYAAVPVSIWDEDWSETIRLVRALPHHKIDDYRVYFENHPDFVDRCLKSVRITDVNAETLDMFHAGSKEEMLASLETVFNTPDTLPGFVGELVALAQGRTYYRTEMDLNTVKGEVINVLLTMTFPPPGSPSGQVIVSLMDISDLKRAQEEVRQSEEKFRTIFEESPMGMSLTAPDGTLLQINEAFAGLLGYSVEEMVEVNFSDITHPEDVAESRECIRSLLAGEQDHYSMLKRYLHRNGGIVWTSVSTHLLRSAAGEPIYFITSILDITELKRVQGALERSNKELEEFAYVASHDLQEPLRMVASYTQLLEQRYRGKLDEKADLFIHYAVDGARRMQNLINDLLLLSRVGTRGKPFEPVESREVVDSVLQDLGSSIEEAGAKIEIGSLPVVLADRGQLAQVFQNLIQNAIKYRGEDSPKISIDARFNGVQVEFRVKDNGIGINPDYGTRIFQVFQRLHERDKYQGSGIGLAIVKKIVERHGGKAWVESEPDRGADFYFTMPGTGENTNHE